MSVSSNEKQWTCEHYLIHSPFSNLAPWVNNGRVYDVSCAQKGTKVDDDSGRKEHARGYVQLSPAEKKEK